MLVKIFRLFLLVLILCSFTSYNLTFAKTPEEECQEATGAGFTCKVCGDCAVVINNVGEHICKKCNDYQCSMDDCNNCSDPDCANN